MLAKLKRVVEEPHRDVLDGFGDGAGDIICAVQDLIAALNKDEDVASGGAGYRGGPSSVGGGSHAAAPTTPRSAGGGSRGRVAGTPDSRGGSRAPLSESRVVVWLTDPASLRPEGKPSTLSVYELTDGVMNIYVSKRVPNVAESVLHCFLKASGYTHGQCVLLERLVSAGWNGAQSPILADRTLWQLQNSSVSGLAALIQRTTHALSVAENQRVPLQQQYMLQEYAAELATSAKQILLAPTPKAPTVFLPVKPRGTLQTLVVQLCFRASWHKPSYADLESLCAMLNAALASSGGRGPMSAVVVRRMVLEAMRRAAFIELGLLYRRFLAYPVRDADVVTTYTEMLGYNDEQLTRIFGMKKHAFGKILYQEIRQQMREDNPDASEFFDEATAAAKKRSRDAIDKAKNGEVYAHGLFYSLPALVDLALATISGSGVFGSNAMSAQTQAVLSMAMLASFLISGAANASIAVTGSLYLHQWSLTMIPVVVLERVTAGLWLSVVVGVLGGVVAGILEMDPLMGVLFFVYTVGFSVFLMLVAAVLTLEKGHNFKKLGGRTILWCLPILFLAPCVVWLDLDVPAEPLYLATLFLCIGWMLYRFKVVSHAQAVKFHNMVLTTDEDVLNWHDPSFLTSTPPPSALDKVKQVILARHAFQIAVERARSSLFGDSGGKTSAAAEPSAMDTLVARRAKLYEKELDLLTWFCMTCAQPVPPPWSSSWDRVLGQALDAMWMQAHSMARIRGSLLWVRESNQCAFGAVYFAIIFLDRIVRAFSGGGAFLFLPTASRYSAGVSWATVYFIVASGTLEMVLAAMGERKSEVEDIRIGLPGAAAGAGGDMASGAHDDVDMAFVGPDHGLANKTKGLVMLHDIVAVQRKADRRFFWQQLRRFAVWMALGAGVAHGCMWLFSRNAHRDVWIVFYAATAGYSGILFGLFCKLFLGDKHRLATMIAVKAMLAGLVVGVAAVLITDWHASPIFSILAAGVVYGGLCWYHAVRRRQLLDNDESPLSILTPAMQTSGQRWVGLDFSRKAQCESWQDMFALQARAVQPEFRSQVFPQSNVGQGVWSLISSSVGRLTALPVEQPRNLLSHAFPDGPALLTQIAEAWRDGEIELYMVPDEVLRARSHTFGFCAVGVRDGAGGGRGGKRVPLEVYVGVPWTLHDDPVHVVRPLAEALVHEAFELAFGFSHCEAAIAELLVCEGDIGECIPARVANQLSRQPAAELQRMQDETGEFMLRRTLLDVDVDMQWQRFNPELRQLLVVLLESVASSPAADLLPDPVLDQIMSGVTPLRHCVSPLFASPMDGQSPVDVPNGKFLTTLVARVHLACIMASNINRRAREVMDFAPGGIVESELYLPDNMYSWEFGSGPCDNIEAFLTKQKDVVLGPSLEPAAANKSLLHRAWYQLQRVSITLPRVCFLAFTADAAFGRELHHGMRFIDGGPFVVLRPLLVAVFRSARVTLRTLVAQLLWSTRPFMWVLEKSMRGLNRTLHRVGGRIALVERHRPFAPLTGFAHHYPSRGTHGNDVEVRLNVYQGSVSHEFASWQEPEDNKGISFESVYRGKPRRGTGIPRLVTRFTLDGDGNVTHTCLYKYRDANASVPSYRLRVPGMHEDTARSTRHLRQRDIDPLTDVDAAQMTGKERASYEPGGRVVEEVVGCSNSVTGGKLFVAARYRFGKLDPETVIESLYEYRDEWSILVRKWTIGEKGEKVASQRVIMVLTKNQHACYATTFSYLHPRHPTQLTKLIDARLFAKLQRHFGNPASDATWAAIERVQSAQVDTPPLVKDDLLGLVQRDGFTSFLDEDLLQTQGMKVQSSACARHGRLLAQTACFLVVAAAVYLGDHLFGEDIPNRQYWVAGAAVALGSVLSVGWPAQLAFMSERYYTHPLPTVLARTMLWKIWRKRKKNGANLEAVHARMLDEQVLREARVLRPYWACRDRGDMDGALTYLDRNREAVGSGLFFSDDKSVRSHLHLRLSDLEACSTGGDAPLIVARRDLAVMERVSNHKLVQAVGLDSGTWPMDGGGVASCRRDLVDRIKSVRWFMQAEIGHELRSIKDAYQVERNVLSMQYVPLWGHNFGHLSQTMRAEPFSTFDIARMKSHKDAIRRYFLPLLSQLVVACAMPELREHDVERVTLCMCNMYLYFRHFDWQATWADAEVHKRWCVLWSRYTVLLGRDELLEAEHPTIDNLEEALSFFVHFLTPLSLPLPEQAMVVQSTHHGIQALLGVVAKRLHNSSFVIWDHGILWRERLLALSGFKGASLFSRNCLAGLQRICAFLTLHNADIMVPCTNIGNPGWEAWLAGGRGDSRRMAAAHERISPVVNGMETDRFYVDRSREEKRPSAVMLSHVCDVKDVKNAILSADYIVNTVGVKDYQLIVYGSITVRFLPCHTCAVLCLAPHVSVHLAA